MKNKLFAVIAATFLCAASLCSCGHEHIFENATCTHPETCTECGETRGEILEHNFESATCTHAETCTECGETRGEALGHTLTEANYQEASKCTVCGDVQGEPKTPDFVKYNISDFMEIGNTYRYNTVGADGSSAVYGEAKLVSCEVIPNDEYRIEREGYQWHKVVLQVLFEDAAALRHGAIIEYFVSDYNNIKLLTDSADHSDPAVSSFSVNYNGEETKVYYGQSGGYENTASGILFTGNFYAQLPVGYDGFVVGISSGKYKLREDTVYLNDVYNKDEFLLYRIK